jgi:hypothetical protein
MATTKGEETRDSMKAPTRAGVRDWRTLSANRGAISADDRARRRAPGARDPERA